MPPPVSDPYAVLPPSVAEVARASDRASRRSAKIAGAVLTTLGLAFAAYVFYYAASHGRAFAPRAEEGVPILGGVLVAALGAWWFSAAYRPDPFLEAMTRPGADVARVYIHQLSSKSGVTLSLRFVLRGGGEASLFVGRTGFVADVPALQERARALLSDLPRHYPSAQFGYAPGS